MVFKSCSNPKYYKFFVNSDELTKVLPKQIPDNVKNVQFYYAPSVLQCSTDYILYYIDENINLDKFNDYFKDKAIWIGHKKEYTEKIGLLTGIFSFTPAKYKNEDDFITYLIEVECDDSGYCNHGEYLFPAINENTNEIIYESSSW